jgi:type IV pilus assembly protein PilW
MRSTTARARFSGGFSLIELMVGMTIGLLAVLIITQVMSLFEAQRRATTGTADAQVNGAIGLFQIQRDVQMAGFGLMPITNPALECTTVTYNTTGLSGITGIAPVSIADGTSDSITIRYATGQTGGVVSQVVSATGSSGSPGTVRVKSNLGCQVGDITLASAGATCAFSKVTAVTASPISVTLADVNNATATDNNLACLGSWNEIVYAIDANSNLTRTSIVNGVSSGATPLVAGIVNLQAQYGVSASATSNQVTSWVDASGGTWTAPTVANRNRIKAIRLVVVARNAKQELDNVTASALTWSGGTIDLSANASWQKYRYRTFETIIPLRNVVWARGTL